MPAPTADMEHEERNSNAPQREALVRLERSIPPAYKWASFEAPELVPRVGTRVQWALARAVWREPKLVFTGAASAGKTSLAVACLRRWTGEFVRAAAFVHAYALGIARIQHPAGRGEPEIVNLAMKYPMVLLDDLGSERDMAGSAVPDVIFLRHAEGRPLWVTTGLTRTQLAARYGAGIVRRIFERATVIDIQAGSTK